MSVTSKIDDAMDKIGEEFKNVKNSNYVNVTNGNIDLSLGDFFYLDLSADTTISFSNLPSGTKIKNFTILLHNANTHSVTWPNELIWNNDVEPNINSDYFVIYFSATSFKVTA